MNFRIFSAALLTSVSAFAVGAPVSAQEAGALSEASAGNDEIIVTARRREERLLDVPQVVNAISGNALEELNLTKLEDIQAVTPGLTLAAGNDGFSTTASMRGTGYDSSSSAPPTVEFYLNDALTFPIMLFQSMYDVGQIEVLRGPQGTLRGRASPSGSITITTRRPDLDEFGGFIVGSATDQSAYNTSGALNIPIQEGVAALRIAGVIDRNELNQVRSVNSSDEPYSDTDALRLSFRLEPTDSLSFNFMYSNLQRELRSFPQVESISLSQPGAAVSPIGAGNPVISAGDRLAITDGATEAVEEYNQFIANVDWRLGGQVLSYVGTYATWDGLAIGPLDTADAFTGAEIFQTVPIVADTDVHELRLSSESPLFNGLLDYTIGVFHSENDGFNPISQESAVTVHPFGPAVPFFVASSPLLIEATGEQEETSYFANMIFHFGERTELSAGLRHINFHTINNSTLTSPIVAVLLDEDKEFDPTVYNVSLSHRLADDLMVYANYGTSWRNGPSQVGLQGASPRISEYSMLDPEESESYEVGLKAETLDGQLSVSVAAFRQEFDGFIYRLPNPVFYRDFFGNLAEANFLANVPGEVQGVDLEVAYRPNDHFNVSGTFSYADSQMNNARIPCNDGNFDGVPDGVAFTAADIFADTGGESLYVCDSNQRLSVNPDWSLTVQSEYSFPVWANSEGFVRGLLSYYAENENQDVNPFDDVDAYGLLNLYLGIRNPSGGWEIALFGKNITDTEEVLARGDRRTSSSATELLGPTFDGASGIAQRVYNSNYVGGVRYTAPREVGISFRYAFGSQ